MNRHITIVLALIALGLLLACSEFGVTTKSDYIGKWKEIDKDYAIEIFSDGTVSAGALPQVGIDERFNLLASAFNLEGTWVLLDDGRIKMKLHLPRETSEELVLGEIKDKVLELSNTGNIIRFRKINQSIGTASVIEHTMASAIDSSGVVIVKKTEFTEEDTVVYSWIRTSDLGYGTLRCNWYSPDGNLVRTSNPMNIEPGTGQSIWFSYSGVRTPGKWRVEIVFNGQTILQEEFKFKYSNNITNGIPVISSHTMVSAIDGNDTEVTSRNEFSNEDVACYSYLKIDNVWNETVEWKWYSPNGELVHSGSMQFTPPTQGGRRNRSCWHENPRFRIPGKWHVEIFMNGNMVQSKEFTYATNVPIVVSHIMASAIEENGTVITPRRVFTDEDIACYSYIKIDNVWSEIIEWKWYSPRGELAHSGSMQFTPPTFGRRANRSCWHANPRFRIPGKWRVEIYLNGSILQTDEFTYVSSSTNFRNMPPTKP